MAPSLAFVPVVFVSARTGKRLERALETAFEVGEARRRRVATPEVNRLIGALVHHYPPPVHRGRAVRLLYANQVAAEPPTFLIFTNDPESVTDTYRRYVEKGMREAWGFEGVPLRFIYRVDAKRKARAASSNAARERLTPASRRRPSCWATWWGRCRRATSRVGRFGGSISAATEAAISERRTYTVRWGWARP